MAKTLLRSLGYRKPLPAYFEAWVGEMERQATELADPDPPPPVRMLAEAAAIAWLEGKVLDLLCAVRPLDTALDRRRDRAHGRHIDAVVAIERARRLRLPNVAALQVNIAAALTALASAPTPDALSGGGGVP
jgi:hypothetical protein